MRFKELEHNVIKWANKKDLIENGNSYAQYAKFMEEANEILIAFNKVYLNKEYLDMILTDNLSEEEKVNQLLEFNKKKQNDFFELEDAFGDTLVTLIILAAQNGLQLEDCLEYAYNEIKDRTGKTVGGTFIKD